MVAGLGHHSFHDQHKTVRKLKVLYKRLKMEIILLPIDGAEVFIHIFQNIKRPI